MLGQLEGLVAHAESLARTGETEFGLSVLHAVIHQSITRYADTYQRDELPRCVKKYAKTFTEVAIAAQASDATDFGTDAGSATLPEHCRMLLRLSFNAAAIFVPILTGLLEKVCAAQETSELQAMIEQSLDESADRSAHVQLLLALYLHAGKTQHYLRLAQDEGEVYRLIYALFAYQQNAAAWRTLEKSSLSIDEYMRLLQSPIAKDIPRFADKLIARIRDHHPDTAITLYQHLIEQRVHTRNREAYEKVLEYLTALSGVYQALGQEDQWTVYLENLRKRHTRKRLLLQIIAEI